MQARLQVKKRIDVYQVVVVVDVDHEGEGGYQEAEETEQVERVWLALAVAGVEPAIVKVFLWTIVTFCSILLL